MVISLFIFLSVIFIYYSIDLIYLIVAFIILTIIERKKRSILLMLLLILSIMVQNNNLYNNEIRSFGFEEDAIRSITGRVIADSNISKFGQKRCTISILECNNYHKEVATGRGRINVYYKGSELYIGDSVIFYGSLNGNYFNAKNYRVINRPHLNRVRESYLKYIESRYSFLTKDEKNLTLLLLLGVSYEVDSEVSILSQESGNSHILALSGMHLSLFMFVIIMILQLVFNKSLSKLIGCFIILIYILIVGFKPSLVRAFLLTITFMFYKSENKCENLLLSLVLQILLFPHTIRTISCLLSYSSLCGILYYPEKLLSSVDRLIILPKAIVAPILVTFCALIFTIPLSYFIFSTYQITSLITSPICTLLIYSYMVISLIIPFIKELSILNHYLYNALIFVLKRGASVERFSTLYAYYLLLIIFLLMLYFSYSKVDK